MDNDHTKNSDKIAQTAHVSIHERDAIKEECLSTQSNFVKMVTPEWHEEVISRVEAHEQGSSVTYSLEETKAILSEYRKS